MALSLLLCICILFVFVFCCFYPFLFYVVCLFVLFCLFLNLVLINRRNGPRIQRVLALRAFSTGVIPKELILKENLVHGVCV